jgi:radical SAM protein (TIGR01212 family)
MKNQFKGRNRQKSSPQIFPWGTSRRYNAFVDSLKQEYGSRIQKIIVNAGFSCPNRDGSKGYGGCVYCNNNSFSPGYCQPDLSISEQIKKGMAFLTRRYKVDKFIVYFQPFSNTHAPLKKLQILYEQALAHPNVIGLSIGTRPDCVDEEKISYFEQLARDYFVTLEYGLESPYDKTLRWINRQHRFKDWVDAVNLTAGKGIGICAHIILGLPTESHREMLETAKIISRFAIDHLKIHHLHIVQRTVLARLFKENPFHLFAYSEYIQLVVNFLQYLRPDIKIQRLVGETQPKLLIGPDWGIRADIVQKHIHQQLEKCDVWQGKLYQSRIHGKNLISE